MAIGLLASIQALHRAYSDVIALRFSDEPDLMEKVLKSKNLYALEMKNMVIFCNKNNTLRVFDKVSKRNLESPTVHWYVLMQNDYSTEMLNILREGSQVTLAVKASEFAYKFFTTFVDSNNAVSMKAAGSYRWNKALGKVSVDVVSPLTPDLFDLYGDFGGRTLKSSVVDNWPFFKITPVDESNALPDSGIDANVLNSIAAKLNFTYKLKIEPRGSWGGPQPDGTITGMIGMSARREVDFAINEITITESRETVVDFTKPYFLESTTIVTRAPAQLSKAGAIFSPFTLLVWMLLVLAIILSGPLLSLFSRVMERYMAAPPDDVPLHMFTFNMFRSMVLQGNMNETDHWPHRFIFLFWYLFCFYIYALYQGTLTAVLAVPKFEKPIDSLNDLLASMKKGEFTLAVVYATSNEFIFKEATSGIYKDIWDLFNKANYVKNVDGGIAKVLSGKFGFANAMLATEIRATREGREKFYLARQTFYPQGYGMALNSGAPYKRVFERALTQLTEAGLIAKWTRDEVNSVKGGGAGKEETIDDSGPGAITLVHLQAIFFILALGITTAAVVLFFERWACCLRSKSGKFLVTILF
ncbi:glutamate receptor ionotropic, delta-2-like [Macrobrachium nipponense]|uniref:glutamate receptor ionotropic, delta-2-like n=1 Tax=Macrobrachium nipponense TaxID=159736 RepID=UPI0030C89D7D